MSASEAGRLGIVSAVATPSVPESRIRVEGWLAVVVFGRLYTVVLCDVAERVFGVDWFCHSSIHRIPVYLWVELLLYGPVMWLALTRLNTAVFEPTAEDEHDRHLRKRRRFVGSAACAAFVYGVGIHAADIIEVYSREQAGITDGGVYRVAYFLDEGLSHYVQFLALFFLLGWWALFDRPDRRTAPGLAVFLGVAHGVERSLGVVEGEKWFLGPAMAVWLLAAAGMRWRRVGRGAIDELFVRYVVALAIALPLGQLVYYVRFGGFTPPSTLSDADYLGVAAGAVALAVVITGLLLALAGMLASRTRQGGTRR